MFIKDLRVEACDFLHVHNEKHNMISTDETFSLHIVDQFRSKHLEESAGVSYDQCAEKHLDKSYILFL